MNHLSQETSLLSELENDLHELEVNTFEIEDILDPDQLALSACSSAGSCEGCSSCSGTSL